MGARDRRKRAAAQLPVEALGEALQIDVGGARLGEQLGARRAARGRLAGADRDGLDAACGPGRRDGIAAGGILRRGPGVTPKA